MREWDRYTALIAAERDSLDDPLDGHSPTTYPFWLKIREMKDE